MREARVPSAHEDGAGDREGGLRLQPSRIGPPKSTSSSIANEPKAANVASFGFPSTLSPRANIAGMTIAVRAARRSAAKPGSRAPSQWKGLGTVSGESRAARRAAPTCAA